MDAVKKRNEPSCCGYVEYEGSVNCGSSKKGKSIGADDFYCHGCRHHLWGKPYVYGKQTFSTEWSKYNQWYEEVERLRKK